MQKEKMKHRHRLSASKENMAIRGVYRPVPNWALDHWVLNLNSLKALHVFHGAELGETQEGVRASGEQKSLQRQCRKEKKHK